MAKHKIRIEYLEKQGNIDNLEFSVEPNNVSSKALNDLTNANAYETPFLLNFSDLSGKYKYLKSNGVKYYISSVLSDDDGNIDVSVEVTTTGATSLTFSFSKEYYPSLINVDGINYENSDSTFQVSVLNTTTSKTNVRFLKMNIPNSPLIITNINTGITIDYDETHIINFKRGSQLSTDNETPKYEIVGQYGNCSFIDSENIVINLKAQGILHKPKSIKFILDDEIIGDYAIESWSYNTSNSVVDIEFIDTLSSLQEVALEEKEIDFIEGRTMLDIFNYIKELLINNGEKFENINEEISNWLSSIKTTFFRYDSIDLITLCSYFCQSSQCNIYKNQKGNLEVYLWR